MTESQRIMLAALGLAAVTIGGVALTRDKPDPRTYTLLCFDPTFADTDNDGLLGEWRGLDAAACTPQACTVRIDSGRTTYTTTYVIPAGAACRVGSEPK